MTPTLIVESGIRENEEEQESEPRRQDHRWLSPWMMFMLVCVAGAGDGAMRAVRSLFLPWEHIVGARIILTPSRCSIQYFNMPTTILGEPVADQIDRTEHAVHIFPPKTTVCLQL